MRKNEEIQRAARAFKDAVDFADKLDRGVVPENHHGNGNNREHFSTAPTDPKRGPRPPVPVRTTITQYALTELTQLLRWIASDGQLRTDDQIVDEMVAALGFNRRGTRIERVIQSAIASWRLRG
jgi:hypothetical protein